MKIGLLGLFTTNLTDVTYERLRYAAELGFHTVGAHINVPADSIPDAVIANVKAVYADQNMPLMQVWGIYPNIITPDETVRRAGVKGAQEIIKLCAKLGVKGSGVRPTSMNPRGDWWPHPDNYKPETEDRLVQSLKEIVQVGEDMGIDVVLETHSTTTLNTAETIKRVFERVGSARLKINLDPCNFVGDLPTAMNPTPMVNHIFDLLEQYIATVHLKDYYTEDRFVVHIAETIIGTGLMDFDTILRRAYAYDPNVTVVVEHLPHNVIGQAKRNLTAKINALGLPLGANVMAMGGGKL